MTPLARACRAAEAATTTPPQVTYGLTEFGRDVAEPLTDLFDRITRRLPPRTAAATG